VNELETLNLQQEVVVDELDDEDELF